MECSKNKKYNQRHLVLIIAIYFTIGSCTFLAFIVPSAFANKVHDISHEPFNNKKNDSPHGAATLYPRTHFKVTPSTGVSSTIQMSATYDETPTTKLDICIGTQHQRDFPNKSSSNPTWNGDITKQEDLVQKQYSSLPYPAVRKSDFLEEQSYYKNDSLSNIPYRIYPHIELEYINHFLYNGANNFM